MKRNGISFGQAAFTLLLLAIVFYALARQQGAQPVTHAVDAAVSGAIQEVTR